MGATAHSHVTAAATGTATAATPHPATTDLQRAQLTTASRRTGLRAVATMEA